MTPQEMSDHAECAAIKKCSHRNDNLLLLAILGGIFIAFGGLFSTLIATGSASLPYGVTKLLSGVAFSLGLILVIVGGAELFTGTTLTSFALFGRKINFLSLLKNWIIVYLGNLIGSLLIAFLIFGTREYLAANGNFGLTIFSIANGKMHHSFSEALILGILCNMLVCLAIWLTFGAKSISDKILAIVFPVSAFVALSFEHSVANMYLIPEAILIKTFDPAFIASNAIDVANLNWQAFLLKNLLPVTIGNIIGGVSIWALYWKVYGNRNK